MDYYRATELLDFEEGRIVLATVARSSNRGFTLIELMVTIVIVGVLASIALPSFSEFIKRGQVRTAAESVQNGLQLARGEAVRRNEKITFTLGASSGQTSWVVTDSSGSEIQKSRASGEGSAVVTAANTPATASSSTFNGYGRITDNSDASATLEQVLFAAAGTSLTLKVEVTKPGGQVRLCDPAVTTVGDPRRCLL
jgi:type IV fimbrial biogenesis protein FimT